AACSDHDNFTQVASIATVRLVNDTDTPLSLSNAGFIDTANARLAFGQTSACVFVNLSTPQVPGISVTNAATGDTLVFTPTLRPGANVLIVAFSGASGIQFTTLDDRFATGTDSAGLRFFNGGLITALLMQRNGAAITPFVGFGSASVFVIVPSASGAITFAD